MRASFVPVVLLAIAAPAAAQGPLVGSARALYDMAKGNLVAAAQQMPEEHYGFQPTPDVRTFGQLIGHVANANYMFCSNAAGIDNPSSATNHEQTTAKAGLVKAITDSFAFCDQAYTMSDEKAAEPLQIFGMDMNRVGALIFNATHDWEHYGNIVTYMRIKGLVPPSSQRN